jgi:hypothetical protein
LTYPLCSGDNLIAVYPYSQFQLLVYVCRRGRGEWKVRYHIADYAEKMKMVAM